MLGVEELITLLYLFVLNGVFGDLDDLAADKLGDLNEKFNDLVDKAGDLFVFGFELNFVVFSLSLSSTVHFTTCR